MSGIRMEEREVENGEQARPANPWQDIQLRDVPPPGEGAPQEAPAEQQDNVPGDAGNPQGVLGQEPPENPAETGNPPNEQNEGREAVTGKLTDGTCPKEMKLCLYVIMWALILYLTLGTVIFSVLRSPPDNNTTLETDANLIEITPMTTTIFNATTIVNKSSINVPNMDN